MELREVLDVASQVTSALAAAHQAGIVHRDIKPDNIMLRHDGVVKVLDFGLAKLTDIQARSSNTDAATMTMGTEPGVVMGTPSYMSPEQARGLKVDACSDIWSLGVVLYEMAGGRLPFAGATISDVIATILHREPPSLLLYRSDMPVELERIVEKALTKGPDERYQTAKDVSLDLKRLKQRLEVDAELERSITPEEGARRASERFSLGSSQAAISGMTRAAAAAPTAETSAGAHAVERRVCDWRGQTAQASCGAGAGYTCHCRRRGRLWLFQILRQSLAGNHFDCSLTLHECERRSQYRIPQ